MLSNKSNDCFFYYLSHLSVILSGILTSLLTLLNIRVYIPLQVLMLSFALLMFLNTDEPDNVYQVTQAHNPASGNILFRFLFLL